MIAKVVDAVDGGLARLGEVPPMIENGCDCPHGAQDGMAYHYVEHYCGYKREYPHR